MIDCGTGHKIAQFFTLTNGNDGNMVGAMEKIILVVRVRMGQMVL